MRKPASLRQLHMLGAATAKAKAYHDDGRVIDLSESTKVEPKDDDRLEAAHNKRVRKAAKRLAQR